MTTRGRPTVSSNPSRRMVSIRMRKLQLAAAGDLESVGLAREIADPQRDIAFGLAIEALANDAALDLVAFLAGIRARH